MESRFLMAAAPRRIKEALLESCPKECAGSLSKAWTNVLELLEVGEDLIGVEMGRLDESVISRASCAHCYADERASVLDHLKPARRASVGRSRRG